MTAVRITPPTTLISGPQDNPVKAYLHRLRSWFLFAALAAGWLLTVSPTQAQTGNGTISGRVFNPVTGEYVRNAEVRLQGSSQRVATEGDGSFTLANVPPGVATITVTFAGYNTVTESVNVAAGGPSRDRTAAQTSTSPTHARMPTSAGPGCSRTR